MQCFLLKQFQTMMISKEAWRKRPTTKQTAVIRPRLIFQAVFPAVKKHAIQMGSVRTICSCKWPNRTVREGRNRPFSQFQPAPLPVRYAIPACLPIPMVIAVPACAPGSQKAGISSNTKAPTFVSVQKWGLLIRHRNRRQRSSCSAHRNQEILPESY